MNVDGPNFGSHLKHPTENLVECYQYQQNDVVDSVPDNSVNPAVAIANIFDIFDASPKTLLQ